jgi:hypothetical protein
MLWSDMVKLIQTKLDIKSDASGEYKC